MQEATLETQPGTAQRWVHFSPFESHVQKATEPQYTHMLTCQRPGERSGCIQDLPLHSGERS